MRERQTEVVCLLYTSEVIKTITDFAFDTGFSVVGLDFSPIKDVYKRQVRVSYG